MPKPAGKKLHCNRCGHNWLPLVKAPVVCPRCKTYKWRAKQRAKSAHSTAIIREHDDVEGR